MNLRQSILAAYSVLLRLYPAPFRERFGQEMLQVAGAAEASEWPLIFSDTSLGIARCWMRGTHSIPAAVQEDAYVPVGGSSVSASGLLPGLVLSVLVVLGMFYASFGGQAPACPNAAHAAT